MSTITPSEFFRVFNINWPDFMWGAFWIIAVMVFLNTLSIITVITMTYDWIKKHILPKMYDNKLGRLQAEVKSLKAELKKIEVERDALKARFELFKNNFEEGIKGK